jgi:bifunctional enzyme CysN/CysC
VTDRPHSDGVVWQPSRASREDRTHATRQLGGTVWLTGLPAAGKSTIAFGAEARLLAAGRAAYVLDGDNVRHGLCGDLGFDAAARRENVRRVAEVAALFADAGVVAIVALISPEAEGRAGARELHERAGLPFLEVFVDTPLDVCERRDPKGLYARARQGLLKGLTGVDAPYEPPDAPDLRLRTASETIEADVDAVLEALDRATSALPRA